MLDNVFKKKPSEEGDGKDPAEGDASSAGVEGQAASRGANSARSVGVKDSTKTGWDRFDMRKPIDFQVSKTLSCSVFPFVV